MNRFAALLPVAVATFAAGALSLATIPASAALFGGDKADAKQEGGKAEAKPAPTLKETMSAVGEIARDLKGIEAIEKRLATIEKNVAGIDASLVPVGNALKPEGLRNLADLVIDTAYERAKNILLLVSAFAAVLIAFAAVMLRWALAGRRLSPSPVAPAKEPA